MIAQATFELHQLGEHQGDDTIVELLVALESIARDVIGDVKFADALLDVFALLGDVSAVDLAEDTIRTLRTPGGTEVTVVIPSETALSSGFQLASVSVPPLQGEFCVADTWTEFDEIQMELGWEL